MIEVANSDPNNIRITGLGSFLDSEYVCRMPLDRRNVSEVATEFDMGPMTSDAIPPQFWRAFPGWWRPSPTEDMIYLSTHNFPSRSRGDDGSHFLAAYDPENALFYVWYKFNF